MSNQRSFKIGSFRFAAFVPKKIEYIRFWNKILDRNEMFLISTRKFLSKTFCSGLFPKKFWKPWRNFKRFGLIFIKMQKFCFIPSNLEQTKTFRTGKINLEIVPKSSFLFPLKPGHMKMFWCDNKLIRFCSGFVFKL